MSHTPDTEEHGKKPRGYRRAWWSVGAGAAVLILAVGGGVLVLRGEEGPAEPDHRLAETVVDAHATPTSASEESWTWDVPEHTTVTDMHALPFGPAIELGEGVVALDGATGEEVWHYRRPDATVASASTNPSGGIFALAFEEDASEEAPDGDGNGESEPAHWEQVVLDANTGEIAAEHQIEQQPDRQGYQRNPDIGPSTSNIGAPQTGVHHLTEDARVIYQLDGGFHVQAKDLNDDEMVWTNDEAVDSPGESLEEGGKMYPGQLLVADDVVLASNVHAVAPGSWDLVFDLTALRAESGEVLWQESWEIGKLHDGHDPTLSASPSGDEVAVKFRPEHPGLLLDMDTGEQLATDLWPEEEGSLI